MSDRHQDSRRRRERRERREAEEIARRADRRERELKRKMEDLDYREAMRVYRHELPNDPPGVPPKPQNDIPVSDFEESIFDERIGREQQLMLQHFMRDLNNKKMKKKMEECAIEEKDIRVSQTPASWATFIYQRRMNDVIQNLTVEMTRLAQEKYGHAFRIESRQMPELKKSGLLGGKYSGYGFYVHYVRDRVPNKLLQMN